MGIKTVARLYEQSESDVITYLLKSGVSDKLVKYTATNDKIVLYGIYIRNVKLGNVDFPILKAYTRIDGYVSNLIGMDILKLCRTELVFLQSGTAHIDVSQYIPNVEGSAEIKSLK